MIPIQGRNRLSVNIATYNVLSSHLADPDYFQSCKADWLSASHRLSILKNKLNTEIENGTIICLQELSISWMGFLHAHFSSRGYYLVASSYGSKFNGYMGIGIAVPTSLYTITDCNLTRIADTITLPKAPKSNWIIGILKSWFYKPVHDLLIYLKLLTKPVNCWSEASRRFNQMVCLRLTPKLNGDEVGKSFVVGTYHMPCMFKLPEVMMIHCSLAAKHIQSFAKSDAYILNGDFNIKPTSPMYKLLTSGSIDFEKDVPITNDGKKWDIGVSPMRSVYAERHKKEPEFTNWSKVRDQEPFIDTLDYIFVSKEWKVEGAKELPTKDQLQGPLPIENEPSDHLLLSATVSLEC